MVRPKDKTQTLPDFFSAFTQALLAAYFPFYQEWLTVVFQKHSFVALRFLTAFCEEH